MSGLSIMVWEGLQISKLKQPQTIFNKKKAILVYYKMSEKNKEVAKRTKIQGERFINVLTGGGKNNQET